MCGIAGLVRADPSTQPDIAALQRMSDALIHRGPDDGHIVENGPAAIASRRLSIRDVAGGRQPMTNVDGSWIVAQNGEIYNDGDLRRELESKGYTFRTRCDTEVVLRAFEAWDEGALNRFNGIFAIAAYDVKRGRLILARDRIGVKPLFYTQRDGIFAFASELDALMQSGVPTAEIDPAAVDAYFTYLYIPAPDTIYRGVYKLRPGEILTLEKGAYRLEPYWRPERRIDKTWTLDAAAERFRELLTDSVRLQQVSDVPLGAFLSGGLDSSTVVATLAGVSERPLKTYSIGFESREANELPYARAVADRFETDHHEAIVTPDLVDLVPKLSRFFAEPFADSSAIPTWAVSQLARGGVTVALSGDGGDELFAGYSWLHANRIVSRLRALPARALLRTIPRTERMQRLMDDIAVDGRASFRRRCTAFDSQSRQSLFNQDAVDLLARVATDRFVEHADAAADWPEDDWMLYQDLRMYLPDDVLTKVDRMSMAHSLEVRVPLLDHRIVEFAFTLPFELKMHGRISKRVMKHAFRNELPAECLRQRKRGFSTPIHDWFRRELRPLFLDTALGSQSRCGEWLNSHEVRQLFDDHVQKGARNGHRLWAILMFEEWLRYDERRRNASRNRSVETEQPRVRASA